MENGSHTLKILQFGTGRFLRGFFSPIAPTDRSITVVQSRPQADGAQRINQQGGNYHVWTRGLKSGRIIDEFEQVQTINQALDANTQWSELVEAALKPELTLVVSNTTAEGLQLDKRDEESCLPETCPHSFPAKIGLLLWHRYCAGLPGLTLLPLELVDQNGSCLHRLVLEQTALWTVTQQPEFRCWLGSENRWLNNLVDRIVVSPSSPTPWSGDDPLAVVGEPFRMLAIEQDGGEQSILPNDTMIQWTDDLSPFFLRKVRILNGLHTAMVAKFLPMEMSTVLECVQTASSREWLDQLLTEEILPTLEHQGHSENQFAADVMERFENPFFEHRLADIANGHETKLAIRIQPTADEFYSAFGRRPDKLTEVLTHANRI